MRPNSSGPVPNHNLSLPGLHAPCVRVCTSEGNHKPAAQAPGVRDSPATPQHLDALNCNPYSNTGMVQSQVLLACFPGRGSGWPRHYPHGYASYVVVVGIGMVSVIFSPNSQTQQLL